MPKEITTTTTVYTINELEEEAREKAIDKHRDYNTTLFSEDSELMYECFADQAKEKGIEICTHPVRLMNGQYRDKYSIYWSGFWNQGDGASFEASVDYEDYILKNKLGNKYKVLLNHVRRDGYGSLNIRTRGGHYAHSNTMYVGGADEYFDASNDTNRAWKAAEKADAQAEELVHEILDAAQELADEFYEQLEKEYDWLTSEEQIIESLEANEVLFTEDGSTYY